MTIMYCSWMSIFQELPLELNFETGVNLQMMKMADYIIDLGPGAADEGGRVVVQGTPEMVSRSEASLTARFLRKVLDEDRQLGPA